MSQLLSVVKHDGPETQCHILSHAPLPLPVLLKALSYEGEKYLPQGGARCCSEGTSFDFVPARIQPPVGSTNGVFLI